MKFKSKKKTPFYKKKGTWGILIIVIMVFSTVGFMWQGSGMSNQNVKEYNGHIFSRTAGGWALKIQGQQLAFENLPQELENVSIQLSEPLQSQKIYIADYPNQTAVNSEYLMSRLGQFLSTFNIRPQPACMTEKGCGNIPIVDCRGETPVVVIQEGEKTSVYSENNCIRIQGPDSRQATRATERFMYTSLGIMPGSSTVQTPINP